MACDATVDTEEIKLNVQIECQISYLMVLISMAYANMRGNMSC